MSQQDRFALAGENIKYAGMIKRATARLWPVIKAIPEKSGRANEVSLAKAIFITVDKILQMNQTFLYRDHLREIDFANDNLSLALDIMDTTERLWPTIKMMRDPVVNAILIDIVKAANNLWIINRAYTAQKNVIDEANDIVSAALDNEV